MASHPSNPHTRHRFSSVMTKLHLHKVSKALSKPHIPATNVSLSNDDLPSSHKDFQGSSPPTKTRPAVHPNGQTMRNYASQRSTKIPLRVPAAFPTNLNFSQQTFCLFDAPRDHEEEGDLSCFLDDLFNGPPPSSGHADDSKTQEPTRTTKHYRQSWSDKLAMIHTHLKPRKASLTSPVLPSHTTEQIPDKSPSLLKSSISESPNLNARPKNLAKEQYFDEMDEQFKALFYFKPRAVLATSHNEPKPMVFTHLKTTSPRYRSSNRRVPQMMQRITEDFEEKEAEYLGRRRSVSSPVANAPFPLSMTPLQCPQIDIHLESSPFLGPSFPTLGEWSPRTPSTLQGGTRDISPDSVSQALTPSNSEELGTPTSSPLAARLPIICSKFSMATGSPGIVTSNDLNTSAPHSLPLCPLGDYRIRLQSPPSLPSSLNQRSVVPPTPSRGPGADMFATLEFLSDLCHKTHSCAEEKDSLFDGISTTA